MAPCATNPEPMVLKTCPGGAPRTLVSAFESPLPMVDSNLNIIMERLNVSASNVIEEVFQINLGGNTDPAGVLWTYNIPVLSSNEKKFILEFESVSMMALGFIGNNFPSTIKILCSNAIGYKDGTGSPTTCVAVMTPSLITAESSSSFEKYSILYSMVGKDVAW